MKKAIFVLYFLTPYTATAYSSVFSYSPTYNYEITEVSQEIYNLAKNQNNNAPVFKDVLYNNEEKYYKWNISGLESIQDVFALNNTSNGNISYYLVNNDGNLSLNTCYYTNNISGIRQTTGNQSEIINGLFMGLNSTDNGGAIDRIRYNNSIDANFVKNTASQKGGAIYTNSYISGQYNQINFSGVAGKFLSNSANYGGAIYDAGGISSFIHGTFINNEAITAGGAIYLGSSSSVEHIYASFINNNTQGNGGAIFSNSFNTAVNADFIENTAANYGGAIYNNDGSINIVGSFIKNNSQNKGGAIYNIANTGNSLTATYPDIITLSYNNSFIENHSVDGGAIYNDTNGIVTINGSHFSGNYAANGGAIYNATGALMNINGGYFAGNTATLGGAIYNETDGIINFNNSVQFQELSDSICNMGTINIRGSVYSADYNFQDIYATHYGLGTINIVGNGVANLSANSIIQGELNIENGATLYIDPSKLNQITNINNNGTIGLTSGILNKSITGNGGIVIMDSQVTSNVLITQPVNLLNPNSTNTILSINANNIGNTVNMAWNPTLTLTGGTLNNNISGSGNVFIDGEVIIENGNIYLSDLYNQDTGITTHSYLTINPNKYLQINASNINANIVNDGTLYLTGGELTNFYSNITGTGTIVTMGDISGFASHFGNNINNAYALTLSGGTLSNNITGDGNIIIDGFVTVEDGVSIANTLNINQGKGLTISANDISSNIVNNGTLSLNGGTLTSTSITGNGNITIIGDVISSVNVYKPINIAQNSSLSIDADNVYSFIGGAGTLELGAGTLNNNISVNNVNINGNVFASADNLHGWNIVNNSHNLILTGGTLQRSLTGTGTTIIDGNVVVDNIIVNGEQAAIFNHILINSNGVLHVNDNTMKNTVQNNGILYFGGALAYNVTGDGMTFISGSINDGVTLNTPITIESSNGGLITSADSIGGIVTNNRYLFLNGGTLSYNVNGSGETWITGDVINNAVISQHIVNNGYSFISSANNIGADISNYGNVILTGGNLNHNITGGTVTINGNVENNVNLVGNTVVINNNKSLTTSADNISYLSNLSNNGNLYLNGGTLGYSVNGDVYITGNVTNTASQWQSINISNGGTFTTTANLLTNNNAIVNDGTLNITGGNLQQNVTGGNTIIAQNATTSATSFGNLELNGIMNVGTNTVNIANADINGTINLGISALNKNSSTYTGGHIIVNDVTFGDNAKLSLTITDTNLQKGDSSGDVSIITASGTWTGDFDVLTSNNLYDITYNDNSHTFTFARKKFGADLITELNGTELDVNVATVWDELQSSNNKNVQSIINAIDYNSQHNAKKYATLIHNLAPHNNQVTVGAIRNVNTAINNRVTARLATVRTSPVTNDNMNRRQPNRYNQNSYHYRSYYGRSGGDVAPVTNNGLWVEGLYNYAQQKDDTKFSGKTFGVTGGFDSKLTEHLTAGLGYAFNKTTIDADNHDIDTTGHTGFVYAEYKPAQWYLDALLSYNMTNYQDSSALIDNLSVNSDYKTNSFGGSVISGYDFQKGYDLYGGLNYIGIKQDAYTDTAGQYVKADDTQTLTLTAGGKYRIASQNMKKASTILKAAVLYDVMSDDGVTTVTVGNNNYIVRGNGVDPFGVQAGIMFDTLGNNANLSIGYDLEWRNNFISHTGYIKLKYNF